MTRYLNRKKIVMLYSCPSQQLFFKVSVFRCFWVHRSISYTSPADLTVRTERKDRSGIPLFSMVSMVGAVHRRRVARERWVPTNSRAPSPRLGSPRPARPPARRPLGAMAALGAARPGQARYSFRILFFLPFWLATRSSACAHLLRYAEEVYLSFDLSKIVHSSRHGWRRKPLLSLMCECSLHKCLLYVF